MENSIIIIVLQTLSIILTAYLTNYFSTKAKNQATQEDISNITSLIEEIKHSNSKELETIKSELSLINIKHSKLHEKRIEAIEEINKKIYSFNLNILGLKDYSSNEFESLFLQVGTKEHFERIKKVYLDLLVCFIETRIFLDNNLTDKIGAIISKLKVVLNEYSKSMEKEINEEERKEIALLIGKSLEEKITSLLRDLENEYRNLLGVTTTENEKIK